MTFVWHPIIKTYSHRRHKIDSLPSLGMHRCFTLSHLSSTLSIQLILINYQFYSYLLFSNREGFEAVVNLSYRYQNHNILTMKSWTWLFIYLAIWLKQKTPTTQTNSPLFPQTSYPSRSLVRPLKQALQVQMFSSYIPSLTGDIWLIFFISSLQRSKISLNICFRSEYMC